MTTIPVLLDMLDRADELETAQAIAARHGLPSVAALLQRCAPRSPGARALGDLYEALEAKGRSLGGIAALTGRDRSTVYQTLRARTDVAWREQRTERRRSQKERESC